MLETAPSLGHVTEPIQCFFPCKRACQCCCAEWWSRYLTRATCSWTSQLTQSCLCRHEVVSGYVHVPGEEKRSVRSAATASFLLLDTSGNASLYPLWVDGPWPSLTPTVKFHLPVFYILLHLCGKKLQLRAVFCLFTILSPEKRGGELRNWSNVFQGPFYYLLLHCFLMDIFLFSRILWLYLSFQMYLCSY